MSFPWLDSGGGGGGGGGELGIIRLGTMQPQQSCACTNIHETESQGEHLSVFAKASVR